jgi:cystathionine beta-lyase family protein involved in aluminum resistance
MSTNIRLISSVGHGDIGREKLDNIVAKLMGAEAAAVRLQYFSGTHAIASALFGSLRPGQKMVRIPFDDFASRFYDKRDCYSFPSFTILIACFCSFV